MYEGCVEKSGKDQLGQRLWRAACSLDCQRSCWSWMEDCSGSGERVGGELDVVGGDEWQGVGGEGQRWWESDRAVAWR